MSDENEWVLVAIKRRWVPEWAFWLYAKLIPPWVQPFRWVFTIPTGQEPRDV